MINEATALQALGASETGYTPSTLDTGSIAVPTRQTEHHQGTISGVSVGETQDGQTTIVIDLSSHNTSTEDKLVLFPPEEFVKHVAEFLTGSYSPADLPEEENNKQRSAYIFTIMNDDGNATIQFLRRLAVEQGRASVIEGEATPKNFSEYVGLLNRLLSGTEIIYTKSERKNKETGAKFFGPTRYFHAPEDATNPKMFRKGVKLWEQ